MNNFTFSQPLLIPEPAADYAMYFRGGVLKDNGIFVQAGDTLSSETYFNMFSKKYAKYTTLSDIQVRLTVKGQFEYAFHEDYFTLTAVTDCVLRGGEYYSDAPCANDVRLYVGICTFRREEFIAEKIKMFERFSWDKLSPTVGRVKVFIADNGGTIPQTVNENISVIYGPNDG
ncbi:MAG: hypothetical protein LBN42_02825, partial [Oscillospiraceae bacterium]|nr:hypothetical protein [Oscillospiraceae bacterium]